MTCSEAKLNDFLAVSDFCMDLILSGNVIPRFDQIEQLVENCALELGGSATITASQFAKLGGRAALVGCVGEDVIGTSIYR